MMKNMKKKAFTLIEISIVLVIIGIILASVMKGRDLIKSSQIKEFNQVFVSQWETIANSYFSRMALVLDDNDTNGFMDGTDLTVEANAQTLVTSLQDAGIDPCDLVKSGIDANASTDFGCGSGETDVFKTNVDGEFKGKTTIQIKFSNYTIDSKKKNAIHFINVPFDIAQAIDTIRDGEADGKNGSVVAITANNGAAAAATLTLVDWSTSAHDNRDMILILEH